MGGCGAKGMPFLTKNSITDAVSTWMVDAGGRAV